MSNGDPDQHWKYAYEMSWLHLDTAPGALPSAWTWNLPTVTSTAGFIEPSKNAQWITSPNPNSAPWWGVTWYRYDLYLNPSVDLNAFNLSIKLNAD
ncbi:MAG: hypothetical protein LBP52_09125 [Burkholderiaceae bacterium]|nr:hypothetical protein [Burkholderiaceae bacterium]